MDIQLNSKIKAVEISKIFDNKYVLNKISFDVYNGELLSILGSSGCGKTTLMRILIGLLAPDNGHIFKDNVDITNFKPKDRGMGIVFQNYALFENMTVYNNISYVLNSNKELKKDSKIITSELIDLLNLYEIKDKYPNEISGGQQQRVAIARTLAVKPDIILFDEPMSALDADMRLIMRKELKRIQSIFNTTIIYITHDQEEAFAISDRIMILHNGNIEQIDTPNNIINNPNNEYVNSFVINNLREKANSIKRFINE